MMLSNGDEIKSGGTIKIANAGEKRPYPPLIMGGKGLIKRCEIQFVPALQNLEEKFSITEYIIHGRYLDDGEWKPIETMAAKRSGTTQLTFTFTDEKDLIDGKTYSYAVSSIDSLKRESLLSDPITLKTVDAPRLTMVADNLPRKMRVAWKSLENVDGYHLYRRENGGQWKTVARISGANESEYDDQKNMTDQQHYQYYLTAFDGRWETDPSNTVEARTKGLPPAPAGITVERLDDTKIQITWNPLDDPDVDGYSIYRGTDTKSLKRIAKVNGFQSGSYIDGGSFLSGLITGEIYYWAVKGFNRFQAEGEISEAVALKIE
jgi:fibronectin type 3 domain-containing protein